MRARAENADLAARHDRYMTELGLPVEQADLLTGDPAVAHFFEATLAVSGNAKSSANWVNNEVVRELKGRPAEGLPFTGAELGELVKLVDVGAITNAAAKTVFAEMLAGGGTPQAIVARLGLDQALSDAELAALVDQALAALPAKVAEYRAGKTSLLGMFTGQVMKATGGKANPQRVQEMLKERLEG